MDLELPRIVKFLVEGEEFSLPYSVLPEGTYLRGVADTNLGADKDGDRIKITSVSADDFRAICNLILFQQIPPVQSLSAFALMNFGDVSTYSLAIAEEEDMRANMYQEAYQYWYAS